MDNLPSEGPERSREPRSTDWVAELRQQCEAVKLAADEWAIRWQAPEGRFVSALLHTVMALGKLSASVQSAIESAAVDSRKAAEAEHAKARELRGAAEAALRQVRNAQATLVIEQENVTLRMIQETLPMFAERLQKALVIREHRWNADVSRRRYAVAGAVALAVFLAGYALSSWQDSGWVDAFGQCLAQPLQYRGHYFCNIDSLFVPPAQASSAPER